jgi:hypothetical protein
MNNYSIRILNFDSLDFSIIEHRITNRTSHVKTLGRAVGNNVIILDISKEDHKNLSTIQDDDIFYLYLINLINKNKKNVSN